MEQKMKTIGLIGGMSWESTVTYYQVINRTIEDELGGLHSAKILLYSVDFDEIERCQANNEWDKSAEILGLAAYRLSLATCRCRLYCDLHKHNAQNRPADCATCFGAAFAYCGSNRRGAEKGKYHEGCSFRHKIHHDRRFLSRQNRGCRY